MGNVPQSEIFDPAELMKNQQSITNLVGSTDAKRLMELLEKQGGQVRQAAQQAAQGSPQQFMEMMERLMNSKEGADLVGRIEAQAKKAGLG